MAKSKARKGPKKNTNGSFKKLVFRFLVLVVFIFLFMLFLPQNLIMPVKGATKADYNSASFWYYPWGKSGTHKGVDVFAKLGTDVVASTSGFVMYSGSNKMGGNVVLVLGPKWRLHYYAHLNNFVSQKYDWVSKGALIGTVGNSGNAQGKPPHLHYAIFSLVPYPWLADRSVQGYKKMFYLNPIKYLEIDN